MSSWSVSGTSARIHCTGPVGCTVLGGRSTCTKTPKRVLYLDWHTLQYQRCLACSGSLCKRSQEDDSITVAHSHFAPPA